FFQACLLLLIGKPALCKSDNSRGNDSTYSSKNKAQKVFNLGEQLQAFYPLGEDAEYAVTICADVPVNNKPDRVYKKGEPGHVFIILSKTDRVTGTVINRSFGFYPRVPVTTLFKQVRSKLVDNCNREYDASLETKLTKEEFAAILEKCEELAKKKYNLKKFNCYDYVLEIFNSLPGIEKLPLTKVKFPFIFGRGGSPCGLYNDLKKLASNNSAWAPAIRFGLFRSPGGNDPQNLVASY
ncbi:MAG TPA: hypothetical protein VK484_15110, partial [Ferruginibacter sp.]|nr:hypothetical protein [Ferruginibacter sp.]